MKGDGEMKSNLKSKLKSKKIPKRALSVLLAFVMVVTSLPLMITQAATLTPGNFDPVPYWSTDPDGKTKLNSSDVMFTAVLNTDNSIDVYFPRAFAENFRDGDPDTSEPTLEVMGYMVTLTEVLDGQTNKDALLEMYFPLDMVEKTDTAAFARHIHIDEKYVEDAIRLGEEGGGLKAGAIYDIGVAAIDDEHWTSETIHTVLNDIPYYNLTGDYSPNEDWIAREMLRFEERYTEDTKVAGYELSADGKGLRNGADYYGTESGTAGINIDGKFPEMGCDNSNSMHFWISGNSTGIPFSFTTTWSRGHYNFESAEEVWFYVDFRDVQFDKISFNLRANEKYRQIWRDHTDDGSLSDYGHVAYSTKAAGGANAGVKGGIYFQDEAGLWEETTMTDGCLLNFGGYRGFIRIPLEYFVAQETQYITADNDWGVNNYTRSESGQMTYCGQHMFLQTNVLNTGVAPSTIHVTQADGSVMDAERATMLFLNAPSNGALGDNTRNLYKEPTYSRDVFKVPVNKIGTPVTKCLLIQNRFTVYSPIIGNDRYGGMGYMLQESTKASISNNGDNTMTYNITRDDTATYAIEDLIGAGFEVEGWSADSVNNSFDIDRIIFMRQADANTEGDYNTDTGAVLESAPVQFPIESGKFANDRGYKVGIYYDRKSQIPAAIANFIDEYLGDTPTLLDYDTLKFVDNAMELYKDSFPNDTVEDNMNYLQSLYPDAVAKYRRSKEFIQTYAGEDANYYQSALYFEQQVEMLPDPDFLDLNDTGTIRTVTDLMGLYLSFDIGKLDLIGDGTETKFLTIYRRLIGSDIKAGHSIGAYPYIPFNNFEQRYYLNETAFRYYNDGGNIWNPGSKAVDKNNVHRFTVYGDNAIVGTVGDANGWFPRAYNPASDAGDGSYGNYTNGDYFARVSAEVTANGFDGSKGATVNFDGNLSSHYNVLSVSYLGYSSDNLTNLPGLDLSAIQLNDRTADGTTGNDVTRYGGKWANSFVMYIDYSHVKDVAMNLQFIVDKGGTDDVFYFATGNSGEDRIWMLNDDGDWVEIPINTSAAGSDCSTIMPNDSNPDNSLQGYKGFIRIPLSKFRNSAGERLDNVLDQVLIKRAHIAFWSDNNDDNIGKSVTVDGLGFTYDPEITSRVAADPKSELISDNGSNLTELKDLDEYFAVQTDDATAFARAVYTLDAHAGKAEFTAAYNDARSKYDALSDYQKTLPDVVTALAYLEGYDDADRSIQNPSHDFKSLSENYDGLIGTDDWACKFTDADEIKRIVESDLPSQFLDTTKSSSNTRMDSYDVDTASIKWSYFGLPEDETERNEIIQKAIDIYEKGYMRLSTSERAAYYGDDNSYQRLKRAYSVALRVKELIEDRQNIQIFYDKVVAMYTLRDKLVDGTPIPKDYQLKTVNAYVKRDGYFTDEMNPEIGSAILDYYYMSIYAKQMLVTSKTATAEHAKTALMADALINTYINARTRSLTDASSPTGAKIDMIGGIKYWTNAMHNQHLEITQKVAAGDYLSRDDLNQIEYYIRQFEAFKQRFQNIESMYNEYLHLLMPFPSAVLALRDTNITGKNTDITKNGYLFTERDTPATHYINLFKVWARLDKSVSVRVSSDLNMTQLVGDPVSEDVKFTVDLLDGKSADEGVYYSDYFNTGDTGEKFTNRFTQDDPARANYLKAMKVEVKTDASTIPDNAVFGGTIHIEAFDTDDIEAYNAGTLTDGDGNKIDPVPINSIDIPVTYNASGEDFYSISFPAEMEINFKKPYGDTDNIRVLSRLADGDTLSVGLSPDNDYTLTLDTSRVSPSVTKPDPLPTIKYTVGNGDTQAYTAFSTVSVTGTGTIDEQSFPFNIWVSDDEWAKSYVNSYKDDTLTFTAEHVKASAGG